VTSAPPPRRALVTGGSRGIGYAIAEGLIARGLDVVIAARGEVAGEAAANRLGADLFVMDLTAPEDMAALLEGEEFDILINAALVRPEGALMVNPKGFFEAMQVMVEAPFLLIRKLAPGMAERGWGRVVNLSSAPGEAGNGVSVATAALNELTKVLPRDLPDCVKVNAMCPGEAAPEKAAETAIWLATLSEDGPSGGLFRNRLPIAW